MTATDTHRAIDAVWRIESARLIAGLARIVRDVGLAEELAQDALVAALEQWPESGVPRNPGAWLMATAKHRAIDLLRRNKLLERKHEELGRELETQQERAVADVDAAIDNHMGDDLLRLAAPSELHGAVDHGEQRIVLAHADVAAREEARAALPQDDIAGSDDLTAEFLDAEALGVRVAAVARRPQALLVRKALKIDDENHGIRSL